MLCWTIDRYYYVIDINVIYTVALSVVCGVHRLFSPRDNGVSGQFPKFCVKSNTAVFSSKVKMETFDVYSSCKPSSDDESFHH